MSGLVPHYGTIMGRERVLLRVIWVYLLLWVKKGRGQGVLKTGSGQVHKPAQAFARKKLVGL